MKFVRTKYRLRPRPSHCHGARTAAFSTDKQSRLGHPKARHNGALRIEAAERRHEDHGTTTPIQGNVITLPIFHLRQDLTLTHIDRENQYKKRISAWDANPK